MAAYASLRLTPYSIRRFTDIKNQLEATQLTADIQPRVFDEDFPNTILYVGDVARAGGLAQHLPGRRDAARAAHQRPARQGRGAADYGGREAIAVPDLKNNRMQLSLRNYATHEMGKDLVSRDTVAPAGEQALDAAPPAGPRCAPRA